MPLLLVVLLLSLAPGVRAQRAGPQAVSWTSHAPIVIEGDANFTSANGVVAGTGSLSDPYVLSGWSLDANATTAIAIHNTTAPFVIRDLFVHGGNVVWDGILLENVTHAFVTNVTVAMGDGTAIDVSRSSEVNVTDSVLSGWYTLWFLDTQDSGGYHNTIQSFGGTGVLLVRSTRISVVENNILAGSRGIESDDSDNSTISGNTIAGAYWSSITLFFSRSITLRANAMTSNGNWHPGGIELNIPVSSDPTDLVYADTHTITPDNTILGLPILYYKDCRHLTINGTPAGQLILAGCDGVVVSNMTLRDIHGLVTLADSVNWTLMRNSFYSGWITHLGISSGERDTVALNNFYGAGFEGNGADIRMNLPYPSGGNYWSYYNGTDRCSGPSQTICPDPDGFGDTPKQVDIFGTDDLPRMHPVDPNNTAPIPVGSVSPSSGVPSTVFAFNASASTDAQEPLSELQVRWDWNDDGVWDTNWSASKTTTHAFPSPGPYTVGLEVRDSEGWLSMTTVQFSVGPTPLAEALAANWGAIVLVVAIVVAAIVVLWRRRPRRGPPVSNVPSEDELAP